MLTQVRPPRLATCDDDNVDIFEYTLYEMIEIPEELEGDDEWEEEYEEYLIRHEAWKNTKTYVSLNKMNNK